MASFITQGIKAINRHVQKKLTRLEIGRDGRDQRLVAKEVFRRCQSARVNKAELVARALKEKVFKAKSSHPFFQQVPDTVQEKVLEIDLFNAHEKKAEADAAAAAAAGGAGAEAAADGAGLSVVLTDKDTAMDLVTAANEVSVVEAAAVANKDAVTVAVVADSEAAADALKAATQEEFMPINDVCKILVEILNIEYDSVSEEHFEKLRKLCFKCPSTYVQTEEFAKDIYETDIFGPEAREEDVPARDEEPQFVFHELFYKRAPAVLTWPQIDALYVEWKQWQAQILEVSKKFLELQKQAYKLRPDAGKHAAANRQRQQSGTKVPVMTFVNEFEKWGIFAENHPVWISHAYLDWKDQSDAAKTLEWEDVYFGLRESAPKLKNASDALSSRASSKDKLMGISTSFITDVVQGSAGASDAAASSSSSSASSSSDPAVQAQSLEMQNEQYRQHIAELEAENAALWRSAASFSRSCA